MNDPQRKPVLVVEVRCGGKRRDCRKLIGTVYAIGNTLVATTPPEFPGGRLEAPVPSDFSGSTDLCFCPDHDSALVSAEGDRRTYRTPGQVLHFSKLKPLHEAFQKQGKTQTYTLVPPGAPPGVPARRPRRGRARRTPRGRGPITAP